MLWFWFNIWWLPLAELALLPVVVLSHKEHLRRKVTEERRNSKHRVVSPPPPPPRRKRIVRTDFGYHEEWVDPPQGGTGAVEPKRPVPPENVVAGVVNKPLTQQSTLTDYQQYKQNCKTLKEIREGAISDAIASVGMRESDLGAEVDSSVKMYQDQTTGMWCVETKKIRLVK